MPLDFKSLPPPPWSPGVRGLEALLNAASVSFPPAERYGMAAIAAYRDRIADPVLRQQMAGFMQQEAAHMHMHATFNSALALANPNCRRAEKIASTTFRILGRLPRMLRMSISAGMEHVATLLGDAILRHEEEFHAHLPAPIADMWLLHAIEETEHKSVCFDVHQAGVGSGFFAYLNRIAGMLIATPVFLLVMLGICSFVLRVKRPAEAGATAGDRRASGDTPSPGGGGSSGSLGILWTYLPLRRYFAYYRWSFHPWEHDNSDLVKSWISRNPKLGMPVSESAQNVSLSPAA